MATLAQLTASEARRVALAAAGLAAPRPTATPNVGHVARAVRAMSVLQIDSVNVVARAHLLTLFSRLGSFDATLVDRAVAQRRIFEYWGRMASFCPIEDFPLYRPRMERNVISSWRQVTELNARAPGYVEAVYEEVARRGPLTVADLEEPGDRRGPWWGWADGKVALEHLFASGRVAVAFRRNFTRYYDVVERVIPAAYREGEPLPRAEAERRLLLNSARALGVATARELIDHHWLRVAEATPVLERLVADGLLAEVAVDGWGKPAYLDPAARRPRRVRARTLLNPFDPYMWNRGRVARLHGFHYRVEIYVPAPKRVHGYYVLPFLLGDELVARVDLKAARSTGVLQVRFAHLEAGHDATRVATELAAELDDLARWLGLASIAVDDRGDLAPALRPVV